MIKTGYGIYGFLNGFRLLSYEGDEQEIMRSKVTLKSIQIPQKYKVCLNDYNDELYSIIRINQHKIILAYYFYTRDSVGRHAYATAFVSFSGRLLETHFLGAEVVSFLKELKKVFYEYVDHQSLQISDVLPEFLNVGKPLDLIEERNYHPKRPFDTFEKYLLGIISFNTNNNNTNRFFELVNSESLSLFERLFYSSEQHIHDTLKENNPKGFELLEQTGFSIIRGHKPTLLPVAKKHLQTDPEPTANIETSSELQQVRHLENESKILSNTVVKNIFKFLSLVVLLSAGIPIMNRFGDPFLAEFKKEEPQKERKDDTSPQSKKQKPLDIQGIRAYVRNQVYNRDLHRKYVKELKEFEHNSRISELTLGMERIEENAKAEADKFSKIVAFVARCKNKGNCPHQEIDKHLRWLLNNSTARNRDQYDNVWEDLMDLKALYHKSGVPKGEYFSNGFSKKEYYRVYRRCLDDCTDKEVIADYISKTQYRRIIAPYPKGHPVEDIARKYANKRNKYRTLFERIILYNPGDIDPGFSKVKSDNAQIHIYLKKKTY